MKFQVKSLYSSVKKREVVVTERQGRQQTIRINNNLMQNAADVAASWSDENKKRMNACKSQYMTFSLQLNNSISNPVTINRDLMNQTSTTKLLGLRLGSHLTFSDMSTQQYAKLDQRCMDSLL